MYACIYTMLTRPIITRYIQLDRPCRQATTTTTTTTISTPLVPTRRHPLEQPTTIRLQPICVCVLLGWVMGADEQTGPLTATPVNLDFGKIFLISCVSVNKSLTHTLHPVPVHLITASPPTRLTHTNERQQSSAIGGLTLHSSQTALLQIA